MVSSSKQCAVCRSAMALLLPTLTLFPRPPSTFLWILGSLRCRRLPSPQSPNARLPTLVVPRLLRLLVHRPRLQELASQPVPRLVIARTLLFRTSTRLRPPCMFFRILGTLRCRRLPSPQSPNARLPTLVVPRLLRLLVHRPRLQELASQPVPRLVIARTLLFRTSTRLRPPCMFFRILGTLRCRCLPSLLSLNAPLPTLVVPRLLRLPVRRRHLLALASPPVARLAIAPTVSSQWSPTTRST